MATKTDVIAELRATITEQAALIKALDEKAQFNFDQYQKMDAEYLEAGAVCMNRIKELEAALHFAKPLLKIARGNLAPNRCCLLHDEDELAYWDQLSKAIELIGE